MSPGAGLVTRLAPSPTGRLHLGHARSFLLAWWHARSRGGRVLLRIEDLDRSRCRPEFAEACLRDLEWLGLDWDGAPLVQSAEQRPFEEACAKLESLGFAYACVCTRSEVALSAPHAGDEEPRYAGTCRGKWRSIAEARAASRRDPSLRFRVPEGPLAIRDELLGEHSIDVQREIGDFPIRRRDGAFAYQLAVVVDDARQGVTDVVRGADLWPSTARQAHLQRALGLPHPSWWHVPLVVDDSGERLAKRRGSLALTELRRRGIDPRSIVAWAARSAGFDCGERVSAAEIAPRFDLHRCTRAPARLAPSDFAVP
jgi:glutamyl-tRNA synthetase